MTLHDARAVVERYFNALSSKDFDAMRALLHEDVTFNGPLGTTATADEYVAALRKVTAQMTSVERRALIVDLDGDCEQVCQIYDMTLAKPAVTLPIAQWLTVREQRIATVRLFFDPRPLVSPPTS
jgi:ketosteroid isomerase-like protein